MQGIDVGEWMMFIILPEKTFITTAISQNYEELIDWCLKEEDYYTACGSYYRYVLKIVIEFSNSMEDELFFALYKSIELALERKFRDVDGSTSWKNDYIEFRKELEEPTDIKDIERLVREAILKELFEYCDDFGCEIVEK